MRSPSRTGSRTGDITISTIVFDLRGVDLALFLSCHSMMPNEVFRSTCSYERVSDTTDFEGSEVQPGEVAISEGTDSLVSLKALTGTRSHRFKLCTCFCIPFSLLEVVCACASGSESMNVVSRTSWSWMGSPRASSAMTSDDGSSEGGGNEGVQRDSFVVQSRSS